MVYRLRYLFLPYECPGFIYFCDRGYSSYLPFVILAVLHHGLLVP